MRPRLEDASAEEVRAFLAREQGSVLAEQVRKEWLKVLGKKRQWELFRAEHPLLVNDDNEIACYALQARWEQKDNRRWPKSARSGTRRASCPKAACRWPRR